MSVLLRMGTLSLALLVSGCATVHGSAPGDRDPYEKYNRAMYRFNDTVDKAVLKPVAKFYDNVLPAPIHRGVSNFFSNLGDVVVTLNDALQGKFRQAGSDLSRIMFNSTAGLFGLIDVASSMDLPKHDEDFGQTLGYWGVGPGPYLVLPILGPSTVRDTVALPVDWEADPLWTVEDPGEYWSLVVLRGINTRADLLRATNILEQAALDPYIFTREAYLQRRQSLVYDGHPPMQKEEELDIFQDDDGSTPPETPSTPAPAPTPAPSP